jgi:hypothetical protein
MDSSDRLPERIGYWLGEIRALTHSLPDVGGSLLRAEESRRLNLRAIGTPDLGPGLRVGLEALEHSAIAVRSMLRSIEDAALSRQAQGRAEDFREDLQLIAVSALFREIACAFRAFAVLLHAEAQRSQSLPEDDILYEGRDALAEARARLDQLLLLDRRDDLTFAELTFAVRSTVERLIRELRLDDRIRMLEQSPRVVVPRRARVMRRRPL